MDPKKLRPKDSFWDDLESGKLDVFATDMYSRAKRASNHQAVRAAQEVNRSNQQVAAKTAEPWWTTETSDSDADRGANLMPKNESAKVGPVLHVLRSFSCFVRLLL